MAEGGRLVRQGLESGWKADSIAVTSEGLARSHTAEIVERAHKSGARILEVPERLLSQITGKDNPGAIAAAFKQRHLTLKDLPRHAQNRWLALYEIRDPGNLGTIMRTADCSAASGVILLGTCCDPYSIEAVRASMGAVFDIPFILADFDQFNEWRKSVSATLIAASINGEHRHDALSYSDDVAVLMGNEQAGLPPHIESACDELALIPMRTGADSLNLAQATALMAYQAWQAQGYPKAETAK